ncbi:MAG: bifunctional hydroxymethylpyrimidine kinase/phosphomethylpyrimidine kinase [Bryobacteraceae bacterium]|nr:bifunctional hydroxymethylpyrimidine kinase/phosphomethylpyrimidine kinase [Bryobacterales bacterium]MEB2360206.1 bifunctional hydroxymethylpyrimidine kinase/phosphomethylpyrimidine kinase [Bryobacterales bacterium]NUM99862.1 bifunctional hydroxymethylpyrimidine kinase/phosphomethylpyrimidine kinase [Bryobacteraceae bacterium]
MQAVALTIAGSDPSGGAGIQADLKTFHQFGVYGEAAITLLTVQNTQRVSRVETVAPDLVRQQIEAVLQDIPPGAAKTGALGNRSIVETVAALAADFDFPLVVDPVMISKHGAPLMGEEARDALERLLLPVSFLITPNLAEAAVLAGIAVGNVEDMKEAARRLCGKGARSVLVKGGHLVGSAMDVLLHEGTWYEFPAPRIETPNTHGTGCTYSAAITAGLASGRKLPDAVARAKRYIAAAIRNNPGLGRGTGPVQHHASPD